MGLSLAEVAKELHFRIDQEDEAGIPSLTRSGMFEIVKGVFDIMSQALVVGETISVPRFGKFETYAKPARVGRNPRTGDSIDIPERLAMRFRPSSNLRVKLSEADLSELNFEKSSKYLLLFAFSPIFIPLSNNLIQLCP